MNSLSNPSHNMGMNMGMNSTNTNSMNQINTNPMMNPMINPTMNPMNPMNPMNSINPMNPMNQMSPSMGSIGSMGGMGGMGGSVNQMGADSTINPMQGMSVYKPTSGGTKLTDILNKKNIIAPTGLREQRPLQGLNPMNGNIVRQNQYPDQYMNTHYNRGDVESRHMDDQSSQYSQNSYHSKQNEDLYTNNSEYKNIQDLAEDVNNSLQALENIERDKKKRKKKEKENDTEVDQESEQDTLSSDNVVLETVELESNYLKLFTEFIILLSLYVILSQGFVVTFAAKYIHQLNPTEEGTINLSGIIIYGLIITILFLVIRKIIFSKF